MRRLTITAAILAVAGFVVPARASRDAGLELAQAAAHEAGLDASPDEVAAIHAVIAARCDGSARCQMRRFFSRRTSRPYLLWLRRDGSRPWGWPARAAWMNHQGAWLELLDVADRVVAGELVHRCEQAPEAWGGDVDRERARRLRLVEVDCGDTRNRFYTFPRSARQEG